MSRFFVVAWAIYPDINPNKVGCTIVEPEQQMVGLPPLFLREEELVHSK
jgi:hypothetical protein